MIFNNSSNESNKKRRFLEFSGFWDSKIEIEVQRILLLDDRHNWPRPNKSDVADSTFSEILLIKESSNLIRSEAYLSTLNQK